MSSLNLDAVPLFPLPNVVLFPRAIMPLHIFEDRYRQMTADALEGDGQIAMALLKDGWERDYYGHPEINPVVCVGRIVSSEKLADGKYNFLLQGLCRATVVRELTHFPYRVARLTPLTDTPTMEIDLERDRQRMTDIFAGESVPRTPATAQFADLVRSHLSTPVLADIIAFTLLDDIALKQNLLEETDVPRRVRRCTQALEAWARRQPRNRGSSGEPSMN